MAEEKDKIESAQTGTPADHAGGMPPSAPAPAGKADDTDTSATGVRSDDAAPESEDEGPSVIEMLATLPGAVRDYLMDDHLADVRNAIYDAHKLDEEDREIALDSELGVFFGTVDVEDFPDLLWQRLGWDEKDEDRAIALVLDILGKVVLPAAAFVGDVVAVIHELGGDADSYGAKPIETRQVTYADGADSIAKATDMDKDLDEAMRKRLRHIIESRLRDVRDENETVRMLTKSKKTGGMELDETRAQEIMDVIRSETRMTAYVEEVIGTVHAGHEEGGTAEHEKFTPEQIKAVYRGSPEEQKDLALRVERVTQEANGDGTMLTETLHDALYPSSLAQPDPKDVAADLIALTQANGLVPALEKDDRFKGMVATFLEGKDDGRKEEVGRAPAGRTAMNIFLQVALRGFAAMDMNDSARYGLRVINLLKKQGEAQYADLVAFDLDKGEFAWAEPLQF